MTSCIFNLFSEALHWIFETLFHWNLTHYLDDFLFVFKPQTDLSSIASCYNEILAKIGLTTIPEKDMNDTTIIHLGFEFDSLKMEVRFSHNKHSHVMHIITDLLKAKSITIHNARWSPRLSISLLSSYSLGTFFPSQHLFRASSHSLFSSISHTSISRCKEGPSMMAYFSLLLIHDLSDPIVTYKSWYRYGYQWKERNRWHL